MVGIPHKIYAVLSNERAPLPLTCLEAKLYLGQFSLQSPPSRIVVYADTDLEEVPAGSALNVYVGSEPFLPNRLLGSLSRESSSFSAKFELSPQEVAEASTIGTANLLVKVEDAQASKTHTTGSKSTQSTKSQKAGDVAKPTKSKKKADAETDTSPKARSATKPPMPAKSVTDTKKRAPAPKRKSPKQTPSREDVTPPKKPRNSSSKTQSSEEVSPKSVLPALPSPRWGHSADWYHTSKQIVVFGGSGYSNSSYNDLWTLDSETECWELQQTTGDIPSKRMGHATSIVGDTLYVFGGCKGTKWLNDVHELNLNSLCWTKVETAGEGPRASYHSATVVGKDIFIFGGTHGNNSSNTLYVYDTLAKEWSQPSVTGTLPSVRSGHSACLVDNKLVIFAGWDEPTCYNDVFVLDISTMSWSQPALAGSPPSARTWHRACAVAESRVLVFGGYNGDDAVNDLHVLDLGAGMTWVPLDMDAIDLHARCGHSMTPAVGRLVVFGGGNNSGGFFNDWPSITVEVKHPEDDALCA